VGGTVGKLLLAPDGKALYYLDRTNLRAGKVQTGTLRSEKSAALPEGTQTLALSPDGKLLVLSWTASKPGPQGGLTLLDAATLKEERVVPLLWAPADVAVGDGVVHTSGRDGGEAGGATGVWTFPLGLGPVQRLAWAWGPSRLRLSPDGKRLFVSSEARQGGTLAAWDLPARPDGKPTVTAAAGQDKLPLGGAFSVSPDGAFLILHSGVVLRGTDLKLHERIEPLLAVAVDREGKSAWGVARDGTLRKYSYPDFRLLGRYRPALAAYQVAVDGKARRLYVAGFDPRSLAERPRAKGHGDIHVYDLKER
jgi:hypothetical protein